MAKYNETKSCNTCEKFNVCKYSHKKMELVERVKSLCQNDATDILSVSMNCSEWRNNIRERGV